MNWMWIIAVAVVAISVVSTARYLRRMISIFSIVFGLLLLFRLQAAPAEASAALATLGGGFMMAGPLRRVIGRGPF